MDVQERVREIAEPLLAARGIELFDVELVGGPGGPSRARVLRLSVDRDGGVDLDAIAEVAQIVSPPIDAAELISGAYTLEVSSPGVERPLRLPAHFRRVVGEQVSVKTHAEVDGERRHRGVLRDVNDEGIVLEVDGSERPLRFEEMASARTVFEWGPAPKPGGPRKRQKQQKTTKV